MAILQRISKWFYGGDKESAVAQVARGSAQANPMMAGVPGIGGSDAYQNLSEMLLVDTNLMKRYADYENMDDYPELASALDIYADDSTIPDSIHGKTVWASSRDAIIRDIIDDCLHRRLRIEEDAWSATRALCKYGNLYSENLVTDIGVVGLNWLPPPSMRRIVDEKGSLLGFVQDTSGNFNFKFDDFETLLKERDKRENVAKNTGQIHDHTLVFFYPWEITHWRIRSKHMRALYGYSILDPARWIWKRLVMLEDTALVYKLTRSPGRYAFYIDTGDLPPKQAMMLVDKVRRRFKKKKLVDPTTGKLDFRYNPLTPDEDFFVPVRNQKEATRIDTIAGPDWQAVDDIEYFRSKLFSAIKIPKQYLGLEGETNKAALAQEDVRFARTVFRIQREFKNGLRKIIRLHLAAINIDPDSVKWDIKMTVPSAIFELQQIEVMNAQAGLASSLEEFFPRPWIMERVFHATEDEAGWLSTEKAAERDREAKQAAATQQDISKMYPEADINAGDEEGAPPAAEDVVVDDRIKSLIESHQESARATKLVSRKVDKMSSKVTFLTQRAANDRRRG